MSANKEATLKAATNQASRKNFFTGDVCQQIGLATPITESLQDSKKDQADKKDN